MSLENHLALEALRSGHGNVEQIFYLLRVVYLSYFLRDKGAQSGGMIEMFRAAEVALERSVTRAENKQGWSLPGDDQARLQGILALHDRQLSTVPLHRFTAAGERLQRFASSNALSPLTLPECAGPDR